MDAGQTRAKSTSSRTSAIRPGPISLFTVPVILAPPAWPSDTYFQSGHSITDWHVYSMAWTPALLTFSVDGREAYRVTRAMVEQRGRWAYDTPEHVIVNQAIGGAYPQAVNGAREPYPGLPQSTVDVIKADKAVMLVDWVRVTGRQSRDQTR